MQDLYNWIDTFVTQHNDTFGGVPCPYARKAMRDKTVDVRESVNLPQDLNNLLDWDDKFEAVILHTHPRMHTVEGLNTFVEIWNRKARDKDLVALEDHPEDIEIVKGVQMNYGKAILIIVQRLSKLNEASDHLADLGYYDEWDEESYKKVVAWRK